jgi:hypothetical protein
MERDFERAALGQKSEPEAVTLEHAANSFLEAKKGEGLDHDTIEKHENMTALLIDYCRRENLLFIRDVGLPHLIAHRAEWERTEKSKLTRRNHQGRLKEFFRYCRKAKWIYARFSRRHR